MAKLGRPVEDLRARFIDRSTGSLRPVDHRSNSACHFLSLLVVACDRSRNQVFQLSSDRYPVDNRSSAFFTLSLSQWLVVTGRVPVDTRSNVGRKSFLHSLSLSGCVCPVKEGGFLVDNRSNSDRKSFFYTIPLLVVVCSRSCEAPWPDVIRSNPGRVHVCATQGDQLMV